MKMRSLYHKGNDSLVGRVIVGLTWFYALFYNWKALSKNYSHEELWKPDKYGRFHNYTIGGMCWIEDNKTKKLVPMVFGQCFSSTTRGDAKGVRIAPASEVLHHPERWEYIEFEIDDELFEETWPDFEEMAQSGIPYDFKGAVLGFINPHNFQDPSKWYCSEICVFVKSIWSVMKRWMRISPRRSAFEMAKKYHEPKPLIKT